MKARSGAFALFCLAALFVCVLFGGENTPLKKGTIVSPVINSMGSLQFFYEGPDHSIQLKSHGDAGEPEKNRKILQGEGLLTATVTKDLNGRICLVGADYQNGYSHVFKGIVDDSVLSENQTLYQCKGYIHSPDICVDGAGCLWAAWAIHSHLAHSLMVMNTELKMLWTLPSSRFSEVIRPKILVDFRNRVWLFWTGVDRGREDLFFSFFEHTDWTEPARINTPSEFPHTLLKASLGPEGNPWLVWSAYDGRDYEVYSCHWTSSGWSLEEQITDNLLMDTFPDISFICNTIPLIIWSRKQSNTSQILCQYRDQNQWSDEICLVQESQGEIRSPRLVSEQGKLGLVWEEDQTLKSKIFFFNDLKGSGERNPENAQEQIIINPSFDDDRYIGFGDSITYGYIDSLPAPDKGYINRLEDILDLNFGDSEVINEGNPAEISSDGLGRINDVLTKNEGRYLLLMEGTNDVVFNDISMDTTAFHINEMAEICLESGVLPLISTIIPRDDLFWHLSYFKQRLYALNDKIREIPGPLDIPFIDMFNEFYYYQEDGLDWRDLLSDDKLHPNEKGYQVMAEDWFDAIKDFPFPPTVTQGTRVYNQTLFVSELGNLIKWQENTHLSPENLFKGYRVYRKKHSEAISAFQEIAFLPIWLMVDYKQYFDPNIDAGQDYSYTVCLVRKDDVEGPCSNIVGVSSIK
ncbi:MAG: hypothetical protein GF421_06830 [Candidatus Aminicenantes bacterium]|nr:hypothetical protein [Candidatus Aminicenantes bacterium]